MTLTKQTTANFEYICKDKQPSPSHRKNVTFLRKPANLITNVKLKKRIK